MVNVNEPVIANEVTQSMRPDYMDCHGAAHLSMNTAFGLVVGATSVDHGGLKSAPQGSRSVCGIGPDSGGSQ